jgi:hypothetical protein
MSWAFTRRGQGDYVIVGRLFVRVLIRIGLLIAVTGQLLSQAPSARDILARFCDLDARGEQLTPDGWQKVAALFVTPASPRRNKVVVVKDFVVSLPVFERGRAEFYVEYIQLGRIDPSQALFSALPPMKVRAGFFVVRQSAPVAGQASSEADKLGEWRIAGPMPGPHLAVDAATRYAAELRANARDGAIEKNADDILAALKRLAIGANQHWSRE